VDAAVHTPINADCDDGQYCNGPESCDADWGCVAGLAPNIDDGLPCTEDACDEDGDTAVHTPINADCDDGQYCNGPETCDANAGCVAGLAPNIDDGIPCTVDTCDEDVDAAQHTPINADCDDDQYCNGAETCDANTGCVAGQAPNIDDGVACTDDSCDEDNDAILFVPNNGACPSGLCESPVCDANQGCTVNTVPNCCGNNIVEAGESCDDGNNVDGDGCDANCQSPCEYVNQFNVHSGPAWGSNPPTYTCQEACALLFGGSANEYSCSTNGSNPDSVNHQAYLSGWGDGQYCSNPQPDDWKKNTFYNCGNAGCAYSAYVSDHCSGTLPNYCFTGCN
jgi:cysteine-rich repeat protein